MGHNYTPINIRDLNVLATDSPTDPYNNNPFYNNTKVQQELIRNGLNPLVYFSVIRALVFDYGFNIQTSVSLVNRIQSIKNIEERNNYFSRLVFTLARKNGFSQNRALTVDEFKNLSFTLDTVDFSTVIKYPGGREDIYPDGFIRFSFDGGIPAHFGLYSDSYDANLLLFDEKTLTTFLIRSGNEATPARIKMVVSDRLSSYSSEYEGGNDNTRRFGGGAQKRAKTRTQAIFEKLFDNDYSKSPSGMYQVPEWTPLLLLRRENRIRWIVQKALRTWRMKKITLKRKLLWDSGYVNYQYNVANRMWESGDPYNTKFLPNYFREIVVKRYDLTALEPIYKSQVDRMSTIIHDNYPITEEELGFFLYEWLDILWGRLLDSKKQIYFQQIQSLISRYDFEMAYGYFYTWLTVNGIINKLDPTVKVNYENVRSHVVDNYIPTSINGVAKTDDTELIEMAVRFVFTLSNSYLVNEMIKEEDLPFKIKVSHSDRYFTLPIENYLDALLDSQEFILRQKERNNQLSLAHPTSHKLLAVLFRNVIARGKAKLDALNVIVPRPPELDYYTYDIDNDFWYPKIYEDLADELPDFLNYGVLLDDLSKATLQNFNNQRTRDYLTSILREIYLPTEIDLDLFLNYGDPVFVPERISSWSFSFSSMLGPILARRNLYPNEIELRLQKFESKVGMLFAEKHLDRNKSISLLSPEEDEIMEAMVKLDGLSLDENSDATVEKLMNAKERVVIINGNEEKMIEIQPAVEYILLPPDSFGYVVNFIDAKLSVIGTPEVQNNQLLLQVESTSPTKRLHVKVPYGKTGYITCVVVAITNGDVVSHGTMPPVKIVRKKTCVRSDSEFTEYESTFRPYLSCSKDSNNLTSHVEEYSIENGRTVEWTFDIEAHNALEAIEEFHRFDHTLCNVYALFKLAYSLHKMKEWSDVNSPFYYKRLWYNGNSIDTTGIKNFVNTMTSHYKEIVQLERMDMQAEQEISLYNAKLILKTYKKLFLFQEYNDYLAALEGDMILEEFYKKTNTITAFNYKDTGLEKVYGLNTPEEALKYATTELPYICVLNFVHTFFSTLLSPLGKLLPPFYPDSLAMSKKGILAIHYANDCTTELLSRFNTFLANMSLYKNTVDNDLNVPLKDAVNIDKLLLFPLSTLVKESANIPNELPVFLGARKQIESTESFSQNSIIDPYFAEFSSLVMAFETLHSAEMYYVSRVKNAERNLREYLRTDSNRYIGFKSENSIIPYIMELTNEEGSPLLVAPISGIYGDRIAYRILVNDGFSFLRFGDWLEGKEEKLTQLEQKAIAQYKKLVETINHHTSTANQDEMVKLFDICKTYNSLIL